MTIDSFNEALKRIDSKRLSCVFNGMKLRYDVVGTDAKNVRYLIYSIPLGQLDMYAPLVLEGIRKAKFYTAKEKNQMLDEREERDEKHAKKKSEEDMEYATAEAYDILKRMEGQRITLPGFSINDKRRVAPESVA